MKKAAGLAIVLMALISFITPAVAFSLPVQASYTVTPSTSIDNPSTAQIEAKPGMDIVVKADATVKYTGSASMNSPGLTVVTDLRLTKGSTQIASATGSYNVESMSLEPNKSYSKSGSSTIHIPANTAPGSYVLTAAAYTDIPVVGRKGDTRNFVISVLGESNTTSGNATVTPTPSPLPRTNVTLAFNNTDLAGNYTPGQNFSVLVQGNGLNGTISGQILMNGSTPDVSNLTLDTEDVTSDVAGTGAAASVKLNLTGIPDDAGLRMSIVQEPAEDVQTQYLLSAVRNGVDINETAYVLIVEKHNLANGRDIRNAVITMKVSPEWVEAHGGADAIKIFRYDNGRSEMLETHYAGNENGLMVFEGISPSGLSIFALTAVNELPKPMQEAAGKGANMNVLLILGAISAIVLVVAGVVGYVVVKKKK
mgnify:CR=1 FL=1